MSNTTDYCEKVAEPDKEATNEKRKEEYVKKAASQLTTTIAPVADQTLALDAEPELEYVPDGGREAWTVVLGSSLALFASAGMINAYVSRLPHVVGRSADGDHPGAVL